MGETANDLIYKIGITQIKGIGNTLAKNLIAYLGSAEAVFKEKQSTLAKIPGIGDKLSREIVNQNIIDRAKKELDFILKKNISTHFYLEKNYPFRLKECSDAPVLLFSKGNIDLNNGKLIAVVGTRNITEMGKENCRKLIEDIAREEINAVIVSGLAYGADICAHKAAIETGLPTVAVFGHGLDRIYPSIHTNCAKKIIDNGAVVTEYLSGTNPDRQNFVQRNRIIAGLCDATVVVESKKKGGSLITAVCANDYNRDVFTFPGRVSDECSAGCNELIKKNQAALIECADDLLAFMSWKTPKTAGKKEIQQKIFVDLSEDEQKILEILRSNSDGIQINDIAVRAARPFSLVSSLLLTMEFAGWIKCYPGNLYKANV